MNPDVPNTAAFLLSKFFSFMALLPQTSNFTLKVPFYHLAIDFMWHHTDCFTVQYGTNFLSPKIYVLYVAFVCFSWYLTQQCLNQNKCLINLE